MNGAVADIGFRNPWSWYPVVASNALLPGKPMPAALCGERLVVWRSMGGRASVWSDRCPHRGMRLSFGATLGDVLICPYHGWRFGADGHCEHIPAHPALTPSRAARARIYPTVEQDGYVWASIGEPAAPKPAPLGDVIPVRTLHLPVDNDVAMVALQVSPFHPGVAAGAPLGETIEDVSLTRDDGGRVRLKADIAGMTFVATVAPPGRVDCEISAAGAASIRYHVLIQPTSAGRCAVHLALAPPGDHELARELNRVLVNFRDGLLRLMDDRVFIKVREELAHRQSDEIEA